MATVFTEKNLRGNQGGHQGLVGYSIDENELKSLIRFMEKLKLSDSQTKVKLRQGMRKAAKPILQELKNIVPVESKQLRKSLAIIHGKSKRNAMPAVYVGPRVKNAYKSKDKSGFYMYFLEYGTA